MPIGFLLSQLSRDKIDLERDAVAFQAVVQRLRSHLMQEGLLDDEACIRMTAVERAAKKLLRINFMRRASDEEFEEFHVAVTELRHALLRSDL